MENWQRVWRHGLAPRLSLAGLEALRRALLRDDRRLVQGFTTCPPAFASLQDWEVEAACALGFCGWKGEGLETVAKVIDFFHRVCSEADQVLGEPAACRCFLDWFDQTPRPQMRRQLLAEVNRALEEGRAVAA